jgi:hypothetical protein
LKAGVPSSEGFLQGAAERNAVGFTLPSAIICGIVD